MHIITTFENFVPAQAADAEQFITNAFSLSRTGHDIELLIPFKKSREQPVTSELANYYDVKGPLRIRELPSSDMHIGATHLYHAYQVVRDENFYTADLIYTRNLAMMTACLRAGQKVLYEHYRPWTEQFPPLQPWFRWALTHPNFVGMILHSEFAKQSYVRFGIPSEQLCVCHNGYEPARFDPILTIEEARTKLNLPQHKHIVVYTGRINGRKGLDTVIELAKKCPDVLFVLVGSTGAHEVESLATDISNIQIVPWQSFSNVTPYLYAADVLIIPPSLDPLLNHGNTVLPLKVFIYLAASRPILAPDSPDLRELLIHNKNAVLVKPGDITDASEHLTKLLHDPVLKNYIAENNRILSETLTWDARAKRIVKFIEERLTSPQPHARPWDQRLWLKMTRDWTIKLYEKNQHES